MSIPALLEAFRSNYRQPKYAALPQAPRTGSPVPWLTSLYHDQYAGNYGNRNYPGNCSGNLIRDLLFFYQPKTVFDPMTGGGTCKDVCDSLGIPCVSGDLRSGTDAANPLQLPKNQTFDLVWMHPPYWRMIAYSTNPADLSAAATLDDFRAKFRQVIANAISVLNKGGKLVILMGDYSDREHGFIPLVYETKHLCFELGLRQAATDIIRFSHGATSSHRRYRSSFIPGLHDTCIILERQEDVDQETGEILAA